MTFGLAITFFGLAVAGAIVMRIADHHDFPSLGLALWWALQTITTVGYGDVVPTTRLGQVVGGVEMVLGISFVAFLIAGVTSTVIQRGQSRKAASTDDPIAHGLAELHETLRQLEQRLASIESKLS